MASAQDEQASHEFDELHGEYLISRRYLIVVSAQSQSSIPRITRISHIQRFAAVNRISQEATGASMWTDGTAFSRRDIRGHGTGLLMSHPAFECWFGGRTMRNTDTMVHALQCEESSQSACRRICITGNAAQVPAECEQQICSQDDSRLQLLRALPGMHDCAVNEYDPFEHFSNCLHEPHYHRPEDSCSVYTALCLYYLLILDDGCQSTSVSQSSA